MTTVDVELARLIYVLSALGVVLCTSMLCRWLWRPLRFLLLASVISLFFTPFFVDQEMPDGKTQNIVPAFVVMAYDVINDRENWRESIKKAGNAIATVGMILGSLSLILAIVLPKNTKSAKDNRQDNTQQNQPRKKGKHNPYLPEDFQQTS